MGEKEIVLLNPNQLNSEEGEKLIKKISDDFNVNIRKSLTSSEETTTDRSISKLTNDLAVYTEEETQARSLADKIHHLNKDVDLDESESPVFSETLEGVPTQEGAEPGLESPEQPPEVYILIFESALLAIEGFRIATGESIVQRIKSYFSRKEEETEDTGSPEVALNVNIEIEPTDDSNIKIINIENTNGNSDDDIEK